MYCFFSTFYCDNFHNVIFAALVLKFPFCNFLKSTCSSMILWHFVPTCWSLFLSAKCGNDTGREVVAHGLRIRDLLVLKDKGKASDALPMPVAATPLERGSRALCVSAMQQNEPLCLGPTSVSSFTRFFHG